MKKKRAPKDNPSTEKVQNAVTIETSLNFEEYIDHLTYDKKLFTTKVAEAYAKELTNWADTDESALKIAQFLQKKGINKRTWYRWCQKYEILADANDFALMALGNRREVGLLTRKYDSQSTMLSMLHYDSDWKDMFAMKAKLMAQEGLTGGQKVVVIEKYPDSPLVPVKRVEE